MMHTGTLQRGRAGMSESHPPRPVCRSSMQQRTCRRAKLALLTARAADTNLTTSSSSFHEDQQQQERSKCPFLASLPTPPPAQNNMFQRLQQLFNPEQYQRTALGPHTMVASPSQLGLPAQYVLGNADHVKTAFGGEAEGITTVVAGNMMSSRRLLGEQSLLMVPEPRHKYLRNLIMPAFTAEAIERLVPRMEAVLDKYLGSWADADGEVKAHDNLRRMTFEFIIAVVLGRDYPTETAEHLSRLYGVWAKGLLAWPFIDLPFTSYGKALAAKQELLNWFQAAVDEARDQLAQGQAVPGILGSLVSAVDEEGNRLTDAEIGDNLLLIMLAGHDTSSTTLTNVMANLQNHPAALAKLREEQQQLLAKHGDKKLSGSLLKEMSYADAVIRETLRLNNVVSGLMRSAARDFELGGYRVPAGTTLYLPLTYTALTDPRWLDQQPDAFIPERMLTPEGQKPGAQMPFGHGPRFCAGYAVAMAEMKVFLALLARGYDFTADTNTEWKQEVGRVPANGLPMRVTRKPAAAPAAAAKVVQAAR